MRRTASVKSARSLQMRFLTDVWGCCFLQVTPLTIELKDENANGIMGSSNLAAVVAAAMPHPARFQLAWSFNANKQSLFIWRALPPGSTHVAMGMVATQKEEPPPLDCMRCVPRRWVKPAHDPPTLIWENTGAGGRRGGLYVVNTLGLMEATTGGVAPTNCWDLASEVLHIELADLYRPGSASAPNSPAPQADEQTSTYSPPPLAAVARPAIAPPPLPPAKPSGPTVSPALGLSGMGWGPKEKMKET